MKRRYRRIAVLFATKIALLSILFVEVLSVSANIDPLQAAAGRVEPSILKAVVKIISSPKQANQTVTGTGFLVSQEAKQGAGQQRIFYLITNKHVVTDWDPSDGSITRYSPELEVYFYRTTDPTGATYKPLKIKVVDQTGKLIASKIALHPNPSIDVAVVRLEQELDPANKIDLVSFDRSFFVPFSNVFNWAGQGDQVFALGYPLGISSLTNNYPIAKAGYVASLTGQEFKIDVATQNRAGHAVVAKIEGKFIVVDGLIVPGNSGGPVVIPAETKVRIDPATKQFQFTTEPTKNLVLGMVSMGLGGSGLTIVVSSDYILELIDKLQ